MSASSVFFPLPITKRVELTADSFCLTFTVPVQLREQFRFEPGQYVTIRKESLRRSYSICSSAAEFATKGQLSVGIKKVNGGQFSEPAHALFKAGQILEVMPPSGRFVMRPEQMVGHHLSIAAGSGITPILSIMEAVLAHSQFSQFTLVYGNRASDQIMFLDAIEGLKSRYLTRVKLIHILSAQPQEVALFNGRIDQQKISQLLDSLIPARSIHLAWLCGPNSMIDQAQNALLAAGVNAQNIRSERFGEPGDVIRKPPPAKASTQKQAHLTVVTDGKSKSMAFAFDGASLLDTALAAGMDLPFACKGGVCCTCRAKVTSGQVHMEKNYTLEAWELDKGFVLTCQCRPLTDAVTVSFDER